MVGTSLLAKMTALGLADSVNPCAIAILAIVLITVLTANPGNRKKVLYSGLAFVAAIFVGYMFYAIVIVQLFTIFAEKIASFSFYLVKGVAVLAMILGALNIKDYYMYKPGSVGTEMPLFMRPKAKRTIKNITSPTGAFFIGIFVTLFLLPCTAGPLIIAAGILTELGLLGALPWILYYNILFVLPMLFVIGLVIYGYKKVDEVSGWKERNIRKLHLVAGILLFLVGLGILIGWL